MDLCLRGPLPCPKAPICTRNPLPICTRLPTLTQGQAESSQTSEERLVPVVVMVPESQLAGWSADAKAGYSNEEIHHYALQAANQAYYAVLEKLGVSGEFSNFPGTEGCKNGPFDPNVKE
jgi:hypothetical protein